MPSELRGTYQGVEIVDANGSPLGEFDHIKDGVFVEDKSARGMSAVNPRTGLSAQTPAQWAERQVYAKTEVRIQNLAKAAATRATKGGSATVPDLAEIKGIRKLEFHIDSTDANVESAVNHEISRLQAKHPDWSFSAIFGP